MSPTLYWIAVAVVTVIASARLTRLATFDHFPPVEWLRNKYAAKTDGTGWQLLAFCAYCASFWITAIVVALGYFAGVYSPDTASLAYHPDTVAEQAWWLVMGTLAGSYVAAVFMVHDGDDD